MITRADTAETITLTAFELPVTSSARSFWTASCGSSEPTRSRA